MDDSNQCQHGIPPIDTTFAAANSCGNVDQWPGMEGSTGRRGDGGDGGLADRLHGRGVVVVLVDQRQSFAEVAEERDVV